VNARDEVLGRIRTALGDGRQPTTRQPTLLGRAAEAAARGSVPRDYRTRGEADRAALLDQLAGRLTDYRAMVRRVTPDEVPGAVDDALTRRAARRIVVPPGLALTGFALGEAPAEPAPPGPGVSPGEAGETAPAGPGAWSLRPAGVEFVPDDGLSAAELDAMDGVITTAAVAIAETGTIILDGSAGQGRRALTLIPDYHLCLIRADQVVALVPEALERLDPARPLTWISGPSATSDIELDRVEGVHGPRTLEVVLICERPANSARPTG
jgi:L-lactate dehydrogenase complex protein LldG